jgi:hypothetical protein
VKPGLYFARLETAGGVQAIKLMVMR